MPKNYPRNLSVWLILAVSYAILFLSPIVGGDQADILKLILLSGAFSNFIVFVDVYFALSSQGASYRKRDVRYLLYGLSVALALVIAIDLGVIAIGKLFSEYFWYLVALIWIIFFFYFLVRLVVRETSTSSDRYFVGALAVIGFTVFLSVMVLKHENFNGLVLYIKGRGSFGEFFLARIQAWLHLVFVPILYLCIDARISKVSVLTKHLIGPDWVLVMAGCAFLFAGCALGYYGQDPVAMFEKGASAILLILGNHFYLVHNGRGFCDSLKDFNTWWQKRHTRLVDEDSTETRNCNLWASKVWESASNNWILFHKSDDLYRVQYIEPAVIGAAIGRLTGLIRLVDLGAGDGSSLNRLILDLKKDDRIQLESILFVERNEELFNNCKLKLANHNFKGIMADLRDRKRLTECIQNDTDYPTIFLAQYVVQELVEIRRFFKSVSELMQEQDVFVAVIPDNEFVRFLKKLRKMEDVAEDELARPSDADWEWVGKYPIVDAKGKTFYVPHFERSVDSILRVAGESGLKSRLQVRVVPLREEELERIYKPTLYYPHIFNMPSSQILVFRKGRPHD
jgi:hypothetical protein